MTAHQVEHFDLERPLDLQLAVLRCQRSALLHGASEFERSVIATIVSELGSNVLKYGVRGTLELRRVPSGAFADVEITARDRGPGIEDVELALTDHYTSGTGLGLGLPGVRRMADELEIAPGEAGGTTVRARKRLAGILRRPVAMTTASLVAQGTTWRAGWAVRPRTAQAVAGDAVAVLERGRHVMAAVVDATGHGAAAHALAAGLIERLGHDFAAAADPGDPVPLLEALHGACSGTVGAAAGIAVLDGDAGTLRYLAVGNVRAATTGPRRFKGVSRDGMLGRRWPSPFVQEAALARGTTLVLWTDGVPEVLPRHLDADSDGPPCEPATLAASIVARHGRLHDDASCLVLRWSG